jgi:hypothetical protein
MLWRQGDIFIQSAGGVPRGAVRRAEPVLAEGELTGHQHRIEDSSTAAVFEHRGRVFLDVVAERARLVHQEHGSIELVRGSYFVWRQREYDPSRWGVKSGRTVLD